MMSFSSCLIMNGPLSDSSSTMEAVENMQDIIEDLSRDDNSTDNVQTNNSDNRQTNDADDDDRQHSKLTKFHAKNLLQFHNGWEGSSHDICHGHWV